MTPMVRFAGRALSWAVIGAVFAALVAVVGVPRAAGGTAYTILTGSMTPSLPPGTVVVTRPVDARDIGVGSVITYQLESGKPAVVTHRVHAQGVDASGEPVFFTKGDANTTVDQVPVRPVQVRGQLWYAVPKVGYVSMLITARTRQLLTMVAVAGLLGYAALMFTSSVRHRRRSPAPQEVPQ